jgi:hypothetical protein
MPIKKYYSYCDKLVGDWLNPNFPSTATYKKDFFLTRNQKLQDPKYQDLMPELFFGDPDRNLAVMLNLNPGYGDTNKNFIGKNVVAQRLSKGYSSFAKAFPYLSDSLFHPDAFCWWHRRERWIKEDILDGKAPEGLHPFSIELCPWHSKKWNEALSGGFKDKSFLEFVEENLLPVISYAAKHSLTRAVLSIGKVYCGLYESLGFTLKQEWGPNNPNWPCNSKTGKTKKVYFRYYYSEKYDIKVICIWLWGSNKTPSSNFKDIEQQILNSLGACCQDRR